MALIKCRECSKRVSSKAPNCPYCGAPVKRLRMLFGSSGCTLLAFLAAVSFVLILVVVFELTSSMKTAKSNYVSPAKEPNPQYRSTFTPAPKAEATATDSKEVLSPKVSQIFAQRMGEYQTKLSAWNLATETRTQSDAKLIELEAQLSAIAAEKPPTPNFVVRQWRTIDERYKTQATLVDTDNVTTELLKTDGQSIKVPKATLIAEDRVYIDKAFATLQTYRNELSRWEARMAEAKEQLKPIYASIALAESPKPLAPDKQQVVDEIKAEDEKQAERDRIAEAERQRRIAEQTQKHRSDSFKIYVTALRGVDTEGNMLGDIRLDGDEVIVAVENIWHFLPYQIRYQHTENMWHAWALAYSPEKPDKAKISIVDLNGNEVGGSRFLAGSLIWVAED